ncbi:DUF423 domain-containing protein [Roseibium sp. HPY-6]|uniref:DUF423 domain-containing protein n=1 Tax=Roseibium sp. HPY-6 TaxID=3229852 RepID=UPI00338ECEDD
MIKPMAPPPAPTARLLRFCLAISGLTGAIGILSLALAAHAGDSNTLGTAARMLMFHAPVFLGIGILAQSRRVLLLPFTALCLACGLILFCGDLFSRAFLESRLFPMAAPIGGMLLIVGWLALALGAFRISPRDA